LFWNKKDIDSELFKHSFLVLGFCFVLFSGISQNIHFSQFDFSPLNTNAAFTGDFEGSWRVGNIYRSQWAAISNPYTTNSLFYDRQLLVAGHKLGAGILVNYDRSGDFKRTNTSFMLPVSYHVTLNTNQSLSLGLQPGISIQSISTTNQTFPDQWNPLEGTFSSNLSSADAFASDQLSFFTLNAGFSWRVKWGAQWLSLGVNAQNLLQANRSFLSSDVASSSRFTPHARAQINLSTHWFLQPLVQYHFSNTASSFVGGTKVGRMLHMPNGLTFIYAAIYTRTGLSRNADAFIPSIGGRYKNIDLGIAYDVNVSNLQTATGNKGAFELSFIYTNFYHFIKKITPSCERM